LAVIAALVLVRAMFFGAQRYQRHEFDEHRKYLQTLLAKSPNIFQVETELGEEPLRIATPSDAAAISHVWTDPRNDPAEIEAKVGKWPETRIYRKSPMLYFIYFDSDGVTRDFSCLTS
jgi:hypothetical protein